MSIVSPTEVLHPAPVPSAPATIEDTGLPIDRIHQLIGDLIIEVAHAQLVRGAVIGRGVAGQCVGVEATDLSSQPQIPSGQR